MLYATNISAPIGYNYKMIPSILQSGAGYALAQYNFNAIAQV
jgi:hypothetical protein